MENDNGMKTPVIPDEVVETAMIAANDAANEDDTDPVEIMRAALTAAYSALVRQAVEAEWPQAAIDVLAERERQQSVEGWAPEHDDKHTFGELADAAACYAIVRGERLPWRLRIVDKLWRWRDDWWKPKERRRDLVRAGALILAEIERLDRARKG